MLNKDKVKLLGAISLAMLIIIGVFTLVYLNPMQMQLPKEIILSMALLLPALALIIGIFKVAMVRASNADVQNVFSENTNTATNEKLLVAKQYLSNTLEQFVLAFVIYYIIVSSIPPFNNYVIVLLGFFFFIGRMFFLFGYKRPLLKAFGFSLTFYGSLLGFLVVLLFYGAYFYYILTATN